MSDLTSRLRGRMEFDEQDFIEKYIIEHGPRGGMQLEYLIKGARYQHALMLPIFEELLKCVEALEKIRDHKQTSVDKVYLIHQCEGYQTVAKEALAALEGRVSEKTNGHNT